MKGKKEKHPYIFWLTIWTTYRNLAKKLDFFEEKKSEFLKIYKINH
jgi:hypothetical protein